METALEILNKYVDFSKDGIIERENAIKAMEEYAEQQSDLIHDIFNKPTIELKPLEILWRKENHRDKFTVPDRTAFYKWIRLKILPT